MICGKCQRALATVTHEGLRYCGLCALLMFHGRFGSIGRLQGLGATSERAR